MSIRTWLIASVTLLVAATMSACATRNQPLTQSRLAATSRIRNTQPATFKAQVAPLLASRCMGCHTPGGRGSRAVEIFDGAGQVSHSNVSERIARIYKAVESGRMPPRGPKFTPDELAVLRTWAEAGAQNN
ncbi:MAG: c-type cytochrome [Candidatus Sericytochromatia bacterium]|nr:c-type cytochrome [Candidatus Sericytochromatia bacterium]